MPSLDKPTLQTCSSTQQAEDTTFPPYQTIAYLSQADSTASQNRLPQRLEKTTNMPITARKTTCKWHSVKSPRVSSVKWEATNPITGEEINLQSAIPVHAFECTDNEANQTP